MYTLDIAGQGNEGANSIHILGSSATGHLFSDLISVTNTTYTWTQYIKAPLGSGEFGFYIDEYDINGNWLSGQWKGAIFAPFTGNQTISYQPTSANVTQIGLQYYMWTGSTFDLYLDSISLTN